MLDTTFLEVIGQQGKATFLQRNARTHVHTRFYKFGMFTDFRGLDEDFGAPAGAIRAVRFPRRVISAINGRGWRLETASLENKEG